jgi:hypothetical protein
VLREAIYLYLKDYRIPPERAVFTTAADEPAGYLLTFLAVNGSPRWVMRFRMGAEKEGKAGAVGR